jgi:hypothetical protein
MSFFVEDTVLSLIDDIEGYQELQTKINEQLRNGFLAIASARLGRGIFIATSDDLREEFDASFTVDMNNHQLIGDQADALLMVSALPPPALKKAQQSLILALQSCVQATKHSQSLHQTTQAIEDYHMNGEPKERVDIN